MIIDKLTEPRTHLESVDLTPNQKVRLWAVMARYGAKQGFSYKRFFDKGFRQWELQGVDNIKRTFLSTSYPQQLTDTEVTQIVSEPGAFPPHAGTAYALDHGCTQQAGLYLQVAVSTLF